MPEASLGKERTPLGVRRGSYDDLVQPMATSTPTDVLASEPSAASGRTRFTLAKAAGSLAAQVSRLTGRGSGVSIRGQVILKLDPNALGKSLAGRRVAVVSGTNGKTTTTHLLHAAVLAALDPAASDRVVSNDDGANLAQGLTSTLAMSPDADTALLETDERVVGEVVRLGRPDVVVLLNCSRDQLDRNHEIAALSAGWREAFVAAGVGGPTVVANADDPLVVWAASAARRVLWISTDSRRSLDAGLCPRCGAPLPPADDGVWACSSCGLSQPEPDYVVAAGEIRHGDRRYRPSLRLPGEFNVGNAAFALAAAHVLGVDPDTAIEAMESVQAPAGRFATVRIGDTPATLMLAKNPAGWAETLPLAGTDPVVLAIDSAAADGRDVSWLWDVDYEQLHGRTVIATGPRATDLAVRLTYADVDHVVVPDLESAVSDIGRPVDVVATYTPFQQLRKMSAR